MFGCATPALNIQSNNDRIKAIFKADTSSFRILSFCYFTTIPEGSHDHVSQRIGIVGMTDSSILIVPGNLNTARNSDVVSISISSIETISKPKEIHITHEGLLTAIVLFQWGNLKVDPIKTSELFEMIAYEGVDTLDSNRSSSLYGLPKWGYDDRTWSDSHNGEFGYFVDGRVLKPKSSE